MQKTTVFSTILVLALLAARVAWAGQSEDSDREAARIATKQATAAYNLGHYDEASSLYEEAYKLDKALTAYRSYLRTAPDDAPNRGRVEAWVRELEWTSDLQNRTAAVKAAQKKEPPTPAVPAPVVPELTESQVSPKVPSPSMSTSSMSTRPDLVSQATQRAEPHSSASWTKWASWVGVGLTAAFGVATIVEGTSAKSSFSDLQGTCGKAKTCSDSQVDGVKSKVTMTNVLLGLTAASAAVAGVAFYFNYSGSKETGASLAWRY